MTFKTYRDQSRVNWGREDRDANTDEIKLGALMRIADATELMAKNHASLVADRDFWKSQAQYAERMRSFSDHRVRALKGVITKLRRKQSSTEGIS